MLRKDRTTYVIELELDEMWDILRMLALIPLNQEAEDKKLLGDLMQLFNPTGAFNGY